MFSLGKPHDEFLDECRDILVGDHLAFPFLDIKRRFRHLDVKVILYFHLAAQTPVVLYLLAGKMDSFGGQYLSASRQYLDLALSAASLASACRRQMDAVLAESGEEGLAGLSVEKFRTVVDRDGHLSGVHQIVLGKKQNQSEQKHYGKEYQRGYSHVIPLNHI